MVYPHIGSAQFLAGDSPNIRVILRAKVVNQDRVDTGNAIPPGVGLLIQFQGPGQPKPDQRVSSGLKVQPVPGGGRVDRGDRDFASVPIGNVL